MGNSPSRCVQSLRNIWRNCTKQNIEEEAMLGTYENEPLDKNHEHSLDHELSDVDRANRAKKTSSDSLRRLEGQLETVHCKLLPSTPKTTFKFCSPHHHSKKYQALVSTCYDDVSERQARLFVDQECQTNFDSCAVLGSSTPEPCVLSKEYIVKTYSIQNATPSPSPAAQSKFSPENHSLTARNPSSSSQEQKSEPSINSIVTEKQQQENALETQRQMQMSLPKPALQHNMPSATESVILASSVPETTRAVIVSTNGESGTTSTSVSEQETALTCNKLENTQEKVKKFPNQINTVTDTIECAQDLVISADPSSIPLSLVVLCESLSDRYRLLKCTFIHSSVSDSVPDKLREFLTSDCGRMRADSDLIISFVWKKVANGPHLIVDSTQQSTVQGEANIARYLASLHNLSHDETDILTATQIDEILDMAQLQILEGSSKKRSAALRTLNFLLDEKEWLCGSKASVADIVCWSALYQTNLTSTLPENVKKWLNLCNQQEHFRIARKFVVGDTIPDAV